MHTHRGSCAFVLVIACACGGSTPPASSAPSPAAEPAAPAPAGASTGAPKEPVSTGKDCAKATAECSGGVCTIAMQNDCDQAVTCDASAISTCKQSTDMIQADGRNRDTFAAHSKGELGVTANCTQGQILHTELKSISCR